MSTTETRAPSFELERNALRHLADAAVGVELDTGDMILNLGPQHPATHGTLRLVVRLDGERVVAADPVIGYMHRGYEKLTEFRTYPQVTTLINRIDWLSSFANEVPFIHAAEQLMEIEAPPRAQWIRTVLTELSRIATIYLFLGEMGLQVGALTPAFWGFRDREHVLNLIEAATGGRFHPNFNRTCGRPGSTGTSVATAGRTSSTPSWTSRSGPTRTATRSPGTGCGCRRPGSRRGWCCRCSTPSRPARSWRRCPASSRCPRARSG